MTTQEVANKLVELCKKGKFHEATQSLYAQDIVSVEPMAPPGQSRETKGLDAVMAKGKWWEDNHIVHKSEVEGPIVAGSQFAVAFKLDVTYKPENKRHQMEEIGLYKVHDGKVSHEEFFYAA